MQATKLVLIYLSLSTLYLPGVLVNWSPHASMRTLNAVKWTLTKLTTKSSWYFQSVVYVWYCRLSVHHHCISVLQHGAPSNVLVLGLSSFLHIFGLLVNIFLPFSFPSPFPLLAQCDECLEDYMGAHGWAEGIASHGETSPSGGT